MLKTMKGTGLLAGGGRELLNLERIRRYLPFIVLLLICAGFAAFSDSFLSQRNLETVLRQASVLTIAALGATFIIQLASIDLSVGAVVGLSAVVTAFFAQHVGLAAIPTGIVTGIVIGVLTGMVHALLKVPSFIATLGVMVAGHGVMLHITGGRPIMIRDEALRWIGSGTIGEFPAIVLIALLAIVAAWALQYHSVIGRAVLAIGGGETVAQRSGIQVTRIKVITFAIAGCYSGLAGVVLASRMGAGSPTAGTGLELDVIAAVVVGGTPLTGGMGSVFSTIIGALIITILSNGLNLAGVSSYTQLIIKGFVLVLAVVLSMDRKKIGIIK